MRHPSILNRSVFAFCLAAAGLALPAFAAGLDDIKTTGTLTSEGLKWTEVNADNFPKGMKFAPLASAGNYSVARIWLPPHSQIPPHMHPHNAEAVTLVSGKMGMGYGKDNVDMSGPLQTPGAFFVLGAGDYHYVWTGDDPAEFDVQVEGGGDTTFAPMKMN